MLYYVFSGPLSLRAYVPEIKFNNNIHYLGLCMPFDLGADISIEAVGMDGGIFQRESIAMNEGG